MFTVPINNLELKKALLHLSIAQHNGFINSQPLFSTKIIHAKLSDNNYMFKNMLLRVNSKICYGQSMMHLTSKWNGCDIVELTQEEITLINNKFNIDLSELYRLWSDNLFK